MGALCLLGVGIGAMMLALSCVVGLLYDDSRERHRVSVVGLLAAGGLVVMFASAVSLGLNHLREKMEERLLRFEAGVAAAQQLERGP